jgi:iron-sulfur cluster assembly accessory protein
MDRMSETATAVLTVTEKAARKAQSLAAKEGREGAYLRVRVVAGGCSGFGYRLTFENDREAEDHIIDANGLRVLVDPRSAPILVGSVLDFNDSLLGGGLKIKNPQAVNECSCGESFSV